MLDFLPYFQIVIGLYISFCFEKLIQSLLWSEDFTKGLTSFYHDWSTLAWHKEKNDEDKLLQERIEQSIRGYVSRTKKLGMFMLISVSTMLLSYCWSGHHTVRNDQFMLAYSIWNICFFVLVFCRRVWTNWWYVILEEAYGKDGRIGLNWMPLDVRKLYFAASASPANFEPENELKQVASKAVFIGLRDNLTIDFFNKKLGIDKERIVKQTDPSYFLDIKQFKLSKKLVAKLKNDQKYALYNFNSNFPLRKELADAIRNVGYKVVSTAYNPYADICFDMVDAYEWAGVFPLMDVIVTERFHDSVFGLRNCKPVIAVDWDPNRFAKGGDSKTKRILEDYGLSHLHHNLYNNSDITPIIDSLKNINQFYDKDSLALLNDQIYDNANRILEKIGTILKNN